MKYILFLFVLLFLESTVTTMPITLGFLLLIHIAQKDYFVFPLAFFSGLLLDILLVRSLGATSIFYVLFLCFVFMYEKKFEVQTPLFVFFALFLGSIGYLWVVGYKSILLSAVVTAIFFSALFVILQRLRYELSDSRKSNQSKNNWKIFGQGLYN